MTALLSRTAVERREGPCRIAGGFACLSRPLAAAAEMRSTTAAEATTSMEAATPTGT